MKKSSLLFLISILFIFAGKQSSAQPKGLGIVNAQLQDSTVVAGSLMEITGTLFNFDTTLAFDGNINFKINLNELDIRYGEIPILQDSMRFQIPANSGVPFRVQIPVIIPYFKVGPNVVIIWPISNRPYIDSVTKIVNVIDPLSIAEQQSFVNSLNAVMEDGTIRILSENHPEFNFQQVRIFDVTGGLLFASSDSELREIKLDNKPNQVYFCEFILNNNERKVVKLIRF